ncbi:hypothetical protein BABINDRAFT_147876 [Babjeviella inositovora NRRL Y-12698]|uniref:Uncharacterized protein n=1 Tax=Babjeviella inositovora NRRL Y-12698 TaxID=984486 RepID=A0A1E3QQ42_9ASCO|nr:uncharacterized protein BABINDRAFT_147876 [Babjeviella inositovora NRRL Y-12698]ODQ79087.1 hypothetical protein BABINDRAFT_147876 [Babjeviella inositovora NRRL Y-12698]
MSFPKAVSFPEDIALFSGSARVSPLARFIRRVCYGSGYSLVLVYIVANFLVKPLLEEKYALRKDVLRYLRMKLVSYILKLSLEVERVPVVALSRNGKLYNEIATQTDKPKETGYSAYMHSYAEEEVEEDDTFKTGRLVKKLDYIHAQLVELHCQNENTQKELHPLHFQMIDLLAHVQSLYTDPHNPKGPRAGRSSALDVKQDIRNIKGLYISGQV